MSRHDALTARASLEPRRWRRDGWDAGLRFGAIVPHADIGPECELGAMAWPNVSVHAGRLYFSAMRAGGEMDETIPMPRSHPSPMLLIWTMRSSTSRPRLST